MNTTGRSRVWMVMDFARRHRRLRAATGAACVLVAVLALYGGPLALVSGMRAPEAPRIEGAAAPSRPAVAWVPPEPVAPDLSVEDHEEPGAEPSATASLPIAVHRDGDAPAVNEAPTPRRVRGADARERLLARRRAAGSPRVRPPPPDLTQPYVSPKGHEKKRCAALIDDIVQVGELEWVVSRELVSCYTTHLHQLDQVAYSAWSDDPRPRKGHEGVRLRPARGPDGDIARAAGVRRGDVMLSIAGVKLTSWSQVAVLAPRLTLNGRIRVRVRRGDEIVVLTYRVRGAQGVARAREGLEDDDDDATAAHRP